MLWSDLKPEAGIVAALDYAGERPEDGNQNEKRAWSERFANGCAIAVAKEFDQSGRLPRKKKVRPLNLEDGTEPLTPLGGSTNKRIDVTIADPLIGLEIGVSLKGLNFKDSSSGSFGKNLTGRLYELADEVRLVHEHLPHALMVGVFFLPLASTVDKSKDSRSSFANAVTRLRERTGRLDTALAGQASRCDVSYVALYTLGNEGYPRGLVRFLNVETPPPKRGRPRIADTLSLSGMVEDIFARVANNLEMDWAEPEPD